MMKTKLRKMDLKVNLKTPLQKEINQIFLRSQNEHSKVVKNTKN